MNSSSSERNPVEMLAEEFLERHRRGERPEISEYTARHPDLAEQIRDLFPALVMMEDVRPGEDDATGDIHAAPGLAGRHKLERLGDYRILREVGHGGMGIVYEAEQESLGRHVALKVLLTHSLLDPKQLHRFQREARAAARLHHTNIVPVYGVGEHEGVHYYIMQFIQGQGLDQVLTELMRLRELHGAARGGQNSAHAGSAPAAAEGLLSGSFAVTKEFSPNLLAAKAEDPLPPAGLLFEGSEPQRSAAGRQADQNARPANSSSSTIHLPGQSDHSTLSHSSNQYFHSVARIGMQVADALAYAHTQGILHRDIKPSNMLLDTQGTVWVTDFGLAKAAAEADLTHTGDIVGTLRYMAPERFSGQADVSSDLYSLGLTLYELLALRPAFDEDDRNKLMQQVMHEEPPAPRRLNPAVPRDLETIVLKAIAREPAHRYQTPGELADDLKRFVEDRPIRARRVSPQERLWRWSRRNPTVAGLAALVQIALVTLLVGGAWSHRRISNALSDKEQALTASHQSLIDKNQALTDKEQALTDKESAREEAVKLRDAAVGQTYLALLNEVRALRLAHTSGWRYQALQKLQSLAKLDTPRRDLVELRSEAMACIGEFDAIEVTRFVGHNQSVWSLDFNADGTLLATAGYDGRLQIWDVNEGRQVREIPDPAVDLTKRHLNTTLLPAVRFRPDGKVLVYATWPQGLGVVNLREGQDAAAKIDNQMPARYLAYDKKGSLLAVSSGDGQIYLYDAESHALKQKIQTHVSPNWYFPVAVNPEASIVAAIGPGHTVQLYSLAAEEKEPISLGRHRNTIRSLCFSPSGQMLASASEDHTVKLWDVNGKAEPITLLGHTARVNCVAFSPDGNLVASSSDDHSVRIWETRNGQTLMVLNPEIGPVLCVAFSPDGSRLAFGSGQVCLYQLTSRLEQRQLAGHTYHVHGLAFHPLKPLLASGGGDKRVILWDLQTGQALRQWQGTSNNPLNKVAFAPRGDLMAVGVGAFTSGGSQSKDFAIDLLETETRNIKRRLAGPKAPVNALAFDVSGKRLAAGTNDGFAFVWDADVGTRTHLWKHPASVKEVAFLDGSTKLVTADSGGHVTIRDLAENRTIQEALLPGRLNCMAVAPGDRGLVAGGAEGTLRFLTLPGLKTTVTLEGAHSAEITAVVFSPDGRLLASAGKDRRVVLWDAHTHQRLVTLPQKTNAENLAIDPDSLRLAICSAEELITLWNLALVRPGLAAVGLDWDGPVPEAKLQDSKFAEIQPSPPVQTVKVALTPIKAAIKAGPVDTLSMLASLYGQGRYVEVIAAAEKAIQAAPRDKELYLALGDAHFRLGNYSQATQAVQDHLDLCPNCTAALQRLAACHAAVDEHDAAIKYLERVLQINANLAAAANSLAWIYANGPEKVRNPEKGVALAQRAVALGPNFASYRSTLGVAYYRLGKFDQAVETLSAASQAKSSKSTGALNQFFLAMSYQRLGNADKAKESYQRAPRWSPEDKLAPHVVRELETVRDEAKALLGIE